MSDDTIQALISGPDQSGFILYSAFNFIYVVTAWVFSILAYYDALTDVTVVIGNASLTYSMASETIFYYLIGVYVITLF